MPALQQWARRRDAVFCSAGFQPAHFSYEGRTRRNTGVVASVVASAEPSAMAATAKATSIGDADREIKVAVKNY